MPEAAVNQDGEPVARQYNVGAPRKVLSVEPEAEAHLVEHAPDGSLGQGVPSPDRAHHAASHLGRDFFSHQEYDRGCEAGYTNVV